MCSSDLEDFIWLSEDLVDEWVEPTTEIPEPWVRSVVDKIHELNSYVQSNPAFDDDFHCTFDEYAVLGGSSHAY